MIDFYKEESKVVSKLQRLRRKKMKILWPGRRRSRPNLLMLVAALGALVASLHLGMESSVPSLFARAAVPITSLNAAGVTNSDPVIQAANVLARDRMRDHNTDTAPGKCWQSDFEKDNYIEVNFTEKSISSVLIVTPDAGDDEGALSEANPAWIESDESKYRVLSLIKIIIVILMLTSCLI